MYLSSEAIFATFVWLTVVTNYSIILLATVAFLVTYPYAIAILGYWLFTYMYHFQFITKFGYEKESPKSILFTCGTNCLQRFQYHLFWWGWMFFRYKCWRATDSKFADLLKWCSAINLVLRIITIGSMFGWYKLIETNFQYWSFILLFSSHTVLGLLYFEIFAALITLSVCVVPWWIFATAWFVSRNCCTSMYMFITGDDLSSPQDSMTAIDQNYYNDSQNARRRSSKRDNFIRTFMKKNLKLFNHADWNNNDVNWAICLDEIQDSQQVIELKCGRGHIFHIKCLKAWSKTKPSWPLCRTKFYKR